MAVYFYVRVDEILVPLEFGISAGSLVFRASIGKGQPGEKEICGFLDGLRRDLVSFQHEVYERNTDKVGVNLVDVVRIQLIKK
ncbi:hypothetical protein HYT00_03030 [Candidatus Giovannonibacteria bacterium]|nr:hypothetical protein [Candidatus Giovannonibacteria bacterium]